jgi:uncharacterized protein YecT (DUF1311 family)
MFNRIIILAGLLIVLVVGAAAAQKKATKISEAEIRKVLTAIADCDDEHREHLDISHLEYFDFNGDGMEEAVVIASTCNAGTGGPDVHAVYTQDAAGKVVELPIEDPPGGPQLPLFGNANYTLKVERGKLVGHYGDTSDRQNPLVVWFKWTGKGFEVDHEKIEGPFPTSYDCTRAVRETDRAICYAPAVAPLDVELGKVYRRRMQQLAPDKKQALQDEQRAWLVSRESRCVIYKWWVDCLKGMYAKRIGELK